MKTVKDKYGERWQFGEDDFDPEMILKSSEFTEEINKSFLDWTKDKDDELIPQNDYFLRDMYKCFGEKEDPKKYWDSLLCGLHAFENLPSGFLDVANNLVVEFTGGHCSLWDDGDTTWWKMFFYRHPNINIERFAKEFLTINPDEPGNIFSDFPGYKDIGDSYIEFEKRIEDVIFPLAEKPGEGYTERKERIKTEQKKKVVEMAEKNGGFLYILAVHYFYGGNEDNLLKIKFNNTPESWERLDKAVSFGFQCLDEENQIRMLAKNPKIEDWDEKEEGWKKDND